MKPSRILVLKEHNDAIKKCVIYVMSRDQRVQDNHALVLAQQEALEHRLPLIVLFCLYNGSGFRAREQFEFMLAGLKKVEADLNSKNIPFILVIGKALQNISQFSKKHKPKSVYFDFSPLSGPRKLQKAFAKDAECTVYVVDTHNVIPVWVTSDKQEYAARTIRPKIHKKLSDWVVEPEQVKQHPYTFSSDFKTMIQLESKIEFVLQNIKNNKQNITVQSGETAAKKVLDLFIKNRLKNYDTDRNNPTLDGQSNLSPYLHFGHISALRILLELERKNKDIGTDSEAFIEELVVRKELSDNFCFYNKNYKNLKGASEWAQKTLEKHKYDQREYVYAYKQFAAAETHDEIWNAAQTQLLKSGKIHGYMRMYWAKKVLEWTNTPETAIQFLVQLNDFYHLDGGDPNGYVGILWSIAGLHDRPWFEREVYGTVRYMNANGLKRKFDTERYIKNIQ